jgi:hypothetical protein
MVFNYINNFISVFFPSKSELLCTQKILLLTLMAFITISVVFNSHFLWTSKIIDSVCYSFAPIIPYRLFLIILTMIFNSVLPNTILVVLNILIINKIGTMSGKAKKFSFSKGKPSKIITRKFIISSLIFVTIFLPLRILNCYVVVYPEANNIENFAYIRKILSLLVCSYYSLYFLVHIFVMNNVREALKERKHSGVIKNHQMFLSSRTIRTSL